MRVQQLVFQDCVSGAKMHRDLAGLKLALIITVTLSVVTVPVSYANPPLTNTKDQVALVQIEVEVANEMWVTSCSFLFDSAIGVGLVLLVWVFLWWAYPPINKKARKRTYFRTHKSRPSRPAILTDPQSLPSGVHQEPDNALAATDGGKGIL